MSFYWLCPNLQNHANILLLLFRATIAQAQMVGSEQTQSKTLYTGTFTVGGDKDTYYPVVFPCGVPYGDSAGGQKQSNIPVI
ncbi:hypothetical protein LAG90_12050 [Marinilongibacter aquaticus]|uniref:hypothetical protein n=1 Tax=Marinilongibacter aquaticus TaxID=2975157 RepID=UPI0021BDD42B|nr:hypothetical protein [Marinilongibacter aquaticus]UBM57550.1 hypothetical protein LAG90_12050 [Marinilongibacter aquaticus]